jgi:hypothetical protein
VGGEGWSFVNMHYFAMGGAKRSIKMLKYQKMLKSVAWAGRIPHPDQEDYREMLE